MAVGEIPVSSLYCVAQQRMQIVDVGSEMLAHTRQAVAQARNLSFPVYDGRHSGCGQHRVDELEAAYGDALCQGLAGNDERRV